MRSRRVARAMAAGVLFVVTACSDDKAVVVGRREPITDATELTPTQAPAPKAPPPSTAATPVAPSMAPTAPTAASTASATSTTPAGSIPAGPGESGLGDPYFPTAGNEGYQVERYTIDLRWQPDDRSIIATTTIEAVAERPLTTFNLELAGLEVADVYVGEHLAGVARFGREMVIDPAIDVAAGPFEVRVRYRGVPAPEASDEGTPGGWLPDGNGGVVVFGEPESAASWFPVNDHPIDKAQYTLIITVPNGVGVAANGIATDPVTEGELTTWEFTTTTPQAPYLTTVLIGDYVTVDGGRSGGGTPIRNVFPSDRVEELTGAFAGQPEMIDELEAWFGPFPHDLYGSAVVDNLAFGSALETQTLSVFASDMASEPVIVHELAHQWFGDAISVATWRDVWLNEGFASYAEVLWSESQGEDPADTIRRWASENRGQLDVPPGDPGPGRLFHPSVYKRGGMALHALRLELGDELFRRVLLAYAERFRHGNATVDDFIGLAEELAARPLDDLFDTWLYATELPDRLGDIELP